MGLAAAGFAADAFGDPETELGCVGDGLAPGDGPGGELGGSEERGGGLVAAEIALADLADLRGRELEGTNGCELVPHEADVVGVEELGGLFVVLKVRNAGGEFKLLCNVIGGGNGAAPESSFHGP